MEGYRQAHHAHNRTSHLTKLYSDVKKSVDIQPESNAQFTALHRKYRIQKDRLITWGIEWTDGEKGPDGNIDEAVARAGLTETVDSVLRNIKEVADEAERIKVGSLQGGLTTKDGKFAASSPVFDEARYEDLLRDLTTSIDTLYDLSLNRRALARGEHPRFDVPFDQKTLDQKPSASKPTSTRKSLYDVQSIASSDLTLVNPSFNRPALSPYAGLPARIDVSALRLPEEGPPPYEAVGVPSTTRMVAQLIRRKVSQGVQDALGSNEAEVPVLIEYANFDSIYRDTGVPPPLQRLEALASFLSPMREDSNFNLSLLGFFEDAYEPRIGLVYDLPYLVQNKLLNSGHTISPLSLLKMVQKASKTQPAGGDATVPALEDRFRLALRLTEQLHSLHAQQIAHGNITSSSILFTTTANDGPAGRKEQLRSPLWASFDLFSKCNIEGVRRAINLNIYKHPLDEPQDSNRDLPADIKYDLYGLGVVLLEIGLWTPLSDLYKPKYSLADFKLRLDKLWIPKLAAKCGSAYMQTVETCLRISDDPDHSRLTVEGTYGILLQFLKRCCLLDDVGTSLELIQPSEFTFDPTPSHVAMGSMHPHRQSSGMVPLSRQVSDAFDLPRSQSASTLPPRVDSLPTPSAISANLTSIAERPISTGPAIDRTSPRQSISDLKGTPTKPFTFTSAPSSREFKRRITFIQQRWRERRAARAEMQATRSRIKREEYPWLSLPQEVVEHWQSTLCFQLQRLVEKALKGSPEGSSIRLVSYGETPETARPTLMVGCISTVKVKHILKRHFKYDHALFDVRVKKEDVRRCRRSRRDRRPDSPHRSMAPLRDPDVERASNPDYQERPLCGASIGAYRDDEHLPPVSFGGIVLVEGKPYGMSVHHMLELDDDDDEDGQPAEADADDEDDTSSLGSDDDEEGTDQDTVRPPSAHSSDDEPTPAHDTFGDCPGIIPGDFEEIEITQPALDDALDLNLHAEDDDDSGSDSGIDEDHLLSYKLGQIHASSGLKRTARSYEGGFKSISQSLPQEIDWALFELLPPRVHYHNIVKGGRKFCKLGDSRSKDSFPAAVRNSSDLACAKVHCLGRTSGLGSGTISSTMELVKIHGRSTFSASWTVDGNFGVGGDSGAWVISNDDGRVCGHVLASRKGRTYICPMDLLLDDIKKTLGAKEVSLPTVADTRAFRSSGAQRQPQAVRNTMGAMRLSENTDMGGVALPVRPVKPIGLRVEPLRSN